MLTYDEQITLDMWLTSLNDRLNEVPQEEGPGDMSELMQAQYSLLKKLGKAAQPKEAGQARELPPLPTPVIGLPWRMNDLDGSVVSCAYTSRQMREYARAAQSAPAQPDEREAPAQFVEWFVKNYPGPDTIIMDPKWHAPRIYRAALASAPAQPTRHELQAEGKHPAPCARYCEANAFQIEIRGLKKQLEAAPAQPTVPEGFALVPKEPTVAMVEAGEQARKTDARPWAAQAIYVAMIAAAAPVAQKGEK